MARYLVIISRDRPELLRTFALIFGHGDSVEIRFDRRYRQLDSVMRGGTDQRSRLARDAILRDQGYIVVPQI